MKEARTEHTPSRRALRIVCAGVCAAAWLLISGCSRDAACDDPEVVDKMLALAKSGAVVDMAGECASRLYGRIPTVAAACPVDGNGDAARCVAACKTWAQSSITAIAGAPKTLFQDDLVATRRCRAAVRFEIAFDGGQKVDSEITYVAMPQFGGAQVALSQ